MPADGVRKQLLSIIHTLNKQSILTVHDLDLPRQTDLFPILYDLYDPAHVAGWDPYDLQDLGHVAWVRSVLYRSCRTSRNGRGGGTRSSIVHISDRSDIS